MKVLITTDLYIPSVNGVVTSVLSLAHGLEKMGHEVRILTLSGCRHSKREGNVYYIGSLKAGFVYPGVRMKLLCPRQMIHDIIRWHPDVVHSQCEFNTFHIARIIARRCEVPMIHTYHTVYEDYTHYFSPSVRVGRWMVARFSRLTSNHTDAVIAPTVKVKKLLQKYRVSTHIEVIPTGLEISFEESYDASEKQSLLKKFGVPDDKQVILFLGRLAAEKNVSELFELIKRPEFDNSVLLLVGDGPYRHELENEAKELIESGKVIFAGMAPHSEISKYYRLGDVFANASHSETQGLTYVEAMAAGTPVVCIDDPCVEELIENGVTGYKCCDIVDMSKKIYKLLNNAQLRESVSDNAMRLARGVYSSDVFAASVSRLYEEKIKSKMSN